MWVAQRASEWLVDRATAGDDVKKRLAFSYKAVAGQGNAPSPISVVLHGFFVAITSASATVMTWSFGAHIPEQVDLARDAMGHLLENWPTASEKEVYNGQGSEL